MADEKNQPGNNDPDLTKNQSEQPDNSSASEQEDLFEDDAAIDKLLMDDMFESNESSQNDLEEIDEFAESEIEEFSEVMDEEPETPLQPEQVNSASSLDDSYLDDFDITADDDDLLSDQQTDEADDLSEISIEDAEMDDSEISEVNTTQEAEINEHSAAVESQSSAISESVIGEALTAQVSQLWAEVLDLKKPQSDPSDEIEKLSKNLKRSTYLQEETNKKNKLFANIALGVAALASIIAIVAIVQNSSLKSKVIDLNVLLTDIEDASAGPDITTEKTLLSLKDSNLVLENNQQGLMTQLAMLKNKLETNSEPDEAKVAEQENILKLEANLTEINDKIKALSGSVAKLQKRRTITAAKKPVNSKANPKADWAVNLVSFKQDWYAKKKAAEYKSKGIPVKISSVSVKGIKWYRLSVTGFKTKYEADSYASRAKKALNLSSVWVTQN